MGFNGLFFSNHLLVKPWAIFPLLGDGHQSIGRYFYGDLLVGIVRIRNMELMIIAWENWKTEWSHGFSVDRDLVHRHEVEDVSVGRQISQLQTVFCIDFSQTG